MMFNKKNTKILIIGNGFDLAHDLPTSYLDFIHFVEFFMACISQANPTNYISEYAEKQVGLLAKDYLLELFSSDKKDFIKHEFEMLLSENVWYSYFLASKIKTGNTWIDFESEISSVIQSLYSLALDFTNEEIWIKNDKILVPYIFNERPKQIDDFFRMRDTLIIDLKKFTRALELYLADFVNMIPLTNKIPEIDGIKFDKVICFNYTNTYERLYKGKEITEIEYVHGKASLKSTIETCNLVLGIDEFLSDLEENVDTDFIEFKKFYQRIYKKTGCSYMKWLRDIEQQKIDAHIFIFGHSLDITDKDILYPFLNLEKAKTDIYYHSKKSFGNQIKKLVKLLGEANLIESVYKSKIEFLPQGGC